MKLDELRRQFRARKRSREEIADEMDAFIAEKNLGMARCDCGHLVEEHSGPLARTSLRDTTPSLPVGYCYHCSCSRPKAVAPLVPKTLMDELRGGAALEIEEGERWVTSKLPDMAGPTPEDRAVFAKEIEGEWSAKFLADSASLFTTLPTLKSVARDDIDAKKLLGSYAYHINDLLGSPGEGDLVRVVGFFYDSELKFTVWKGERDSKQVPINNDVSADHLFVVESVECRHCKHDRSMRGRGLVLPCRFCNGLGRDISLKSARLFRKTE